MDHEHDDDLMMDEEDHHHHHHHHHDEEDEELDEEEEEIMDIEPTRVVGVASISQPIQAEEDEFWDHEPTKDEIWEVRFHWFNNFRATHHLLNPKKLKTTDFVCK